MPFFPHSMLLICPSIMPQRNQFYPKIRSKVSSSEVEGIDIEQVAEQFLEHKDCKKSIKRDNVHFKRP